MALKKLPVGIQTFDEIRSGDYLYIDKTKEAYNLIDKYKYAFLSRPRRFGKSLFIDTLRNIFEAKKDLFEGLYIYDKWDWSQKYPVIMIDWKGDMQTLDELKRRALDNFKENQYRLGIECEDDNPSSCFNELIQKAYHKYNQRVVILIDEYDKPILDVIEDTQKAKVNREFIKGLYSIIKGNDEYVKFAFLTGVSKFSKASIFSGLNMLTDISLVERFGNICGYTHENIENEFKEYLVDIDLDRVKEYYNGYYFLKDRICNPFDILLFISNDFKYKNYWFESGNPSFLIKLIKQNGYFLPRLSNLIVGEELLNSFDVEKIKVEVILYQSGYLTIEKEVDDEDFIEYKLRLPNKEVKSSFNKYIIENLFLDSYPNEKLKPIRKSLIEANLEEFKDILISIFASIPYTNYTKNNISEYEGFYASVVYVYLQSLGVEIVGEDVTNRGRIDLTIFIEDKIYILEFKVIENGKLRMENENSALKQIKEKNYAQKYQSQITSNQYTIYLIGIEFDKKERNICSFAWERV